MNKQEKELKQKTFGEVFTPKPLVDEMLSKLPQEVFTDESKTFIDNSCGDGAFLKEILIRKINNGIHPILALSTIYGIEIQADNYNSCQRNLMNITLDSLIKKHGDNDPILVSYASLIAEILTKNIICADALTYDYSKFKDMYNFSKWSLDEINKFYSKDEKR